MTPIEKRILQNQYEMLWTLSYILKCAKPDLVGKAGELDRFLDDLRISAKDTQKLIDNAHTK